VSFTTIFFRRNQQLRQLYDADPVDNALRFNLRPHEQWKLVTSIRKLLIVGGGIAGMSLAIALRDSGISAEIVELDPGWSALGIGIALTAPTLRAVHALGLLERCIAAGWSVTKVGIIDPTTGEVAYLGEAPRLAGPEDPASLGIMRPAFHRILADGVRAAGATVRLGMSTASIRQTCGGVDVVFTDGSSDRYELVVGADGINSAVRELVWGPARKPQFTGQSIWRVTVPRQPEVEAIVSLAGGPNANVGFNPVSSELMYVFIVQNTAERERLTTEQLSEAARRRLEGYRGLVARVRDQINSATQVLMRPAEWILMPPPWYQGRVLLIGDAAHATTPHMASGACIAIEDAVVLGELLRSNRPLELALEDFVTRRYDRCRMVVEHSVQLGEWQQHPDAPGADPVRLMHESNELLARPI
jgi:2-polyprenyl-6-methoxyphenol hydroxylase-like FAD-dependent oxidoreductase